MEKFYIDKFGKLSVNSNVYNTLFPEKCDLLLCGGKCCYYGVTLDKLEAEEILKYSDEIIAVMDETQLKDVNLWFDDYEQDDSMPSGIATGTQVYLRKCVFLNKKSHCSLQIVENKLKIQLKPFYCKVFPYTIDDNKISVDDYHINRIGGCRNKYYNDVLVSKACKAEKELIELTTQTKIG